MRRLALILALAVASPSLAAEPPGPTRAEAQGRVLVEKNCGMCHAVGRTGDSPFSPAPPFRELHKRYKVDDLAEALAEGLITGHPAMPEFRFTPTQVGQIIAYLKSIQTQRAAAAD